MVTVVEVAVENVIATGGVTTEVDDTGITTEDTGMFKALSDTDKCGACVGTVGMVLLGTQEWPEAHLL